MPAVSLLLRAVTRVFRALKTLSVAGAPVTGSWSSKICWAVRDAWNVPPAGFSIWLRRRGGLLRDYRIGLRGVIVYCGVQSLVSAEDVHALHVGLAVGHHLLQNRLHLFGETGAGGGGCRGGSSLGSQGGGGVHELDGRTERVVGGLGIGLRQGQIGLAPGYCAPGWPATGAGADLVGRIRGLRDLQPEDTSLLACEMLFWI
jgi:hypothetical protein